MPRIKIYTEPVKRVSIDLSIPTYNAFLLTATIERRSVKSLIELHLENAKNPQPPTKKSKV